jgi:hypothetical protein
MNDSILTRVLLILFILVTLMGAPLLWAETEPDEGALLSRVDQLIGLVEKIKEEQTELLESQAQALEQVKFLKIWINRRR